jgi:uncharacterized protein (DUF433 family)
MIYDSTEAPAPSATMMQLPGFLHEQDGEVRLIGHRIGLFHLLAFHEEGYSAEMLREHFPTLSMAQIHKVLAFYWVNMVEIDATVSRTREQPEAARAAGKTQDPTVLRSRLTRVRARVTRIDS